jgi:hypothetical protein
MSKNMFQQGFGNWTQYLSMFALSKGDEIDLHFGQRDKSIRYDEVMAEVTDIVHSSLAEAQRKGRPYLMFVHGRSTSRRGKTTARSQVRNFMRSKAATPLIERKHCIQHETVFVAKVRPVSKLKANVPDARLIVPANDYMPPFLKDICADHDKFAAERKQQNEARARRQAIIDGLKKPDR